MKPVDKINVIWAPVRAKRCVNEGGVNFFSKAHSPKGVEDASAKLQRTEYRHVKENTRT